MASDLCPLLGLDHLEFFVGNARQAAAFYSHSFGFCVVAYQGLETGNRKATSYVAKQGDVRFVFSSAMTADHPIAQSVAKHGDTIAIIAFEVADAEQAYRFATSRGAVGAIPPTYQQDEHGVLSYAAVHAYGDVLIKFVDRKNYRDNFAPGFVPRQMSLTQSVGITHVDHIVGNVEQGAMDYWVEFFVKTLGFDVRMHFDDHAISTEYSALMSKVLENGGKVILNINEPAEGRRKSQIQEYLDFHDGPGVQHLGLATNDIVHTVRQLKAAGIEFLAIPKTYYEGLGDWVHDVDIPLEQLAELGILVDRDEDGYLLQLFTKPLGDRPTLFFEIIERHGCRGFGAGNFKSLFVALEREQAARGNL